MWCNIFHKLNRINFINRTDFAIKQNKLQKRDINTLQLNRAYFVNKAKLTLLYIAYTMIKQNRFHTYNRL